MRPMAEDIRIGREHEISFGQFEAAQDGTGEDKDSCLATVFQPIRR